jgi:UDP-N-acetylmuramoyl-tripeptide--D-alanyl-D-alanine ligase
MELLYKIYQKHSNICTDSRAVKKGDLFFALKGESFDGNKYASGALASGAAYAIIDNPDFKESDQYIVVEDVLKALQDLAAYHRNKFDIPVLGLTGSNGKTTTKELMAAILSQGYKVHATKGNFNNHIGVPLTLLSMPPDSELAVIEMGANHPLEIEFLCKIAQPTHGLVTNVGKAHLEGFGSFEGVCKTKAELYQWLAQTNGTTFVNTNEPFLDDLSEMVKKKIHYGDHTTPPLAKLIRASSPYVKLFIFNKETPVEVETNLVGAYNYNNILTAIAIGKYFNISSESIKMALENYTPQNNRSQVLEKDDNTFIMDAYNANPVSMEKALLSFSEMKNEGGEKIAIIGDMLELGDVSEAEHQKIVSLTATLHIDQMVFVGEEFGKVTNASNQLHFMDSSETKRWFSEQNFKKILVLLKGSRAIKLEIIKD